MIIFYTCAHIDEKHRIILSRKSLDFCCYINVSFFSFIIRDDLIHYVSFNKGIRYVEINTKLLYFTLYIRLR